MVGCTSFPVFLVDSTARSTTFMITSEVVSASASLLVFLSRGVSLKAKVLKAYTSTLQNGVMVAMRLQ